MHRVSELYSEPITETRISELLDCAKNGNSKVICAFEIVQLISERTALRTIILQLKNTECWCPMGIGHPSFNSHTDFCIEIQALNLEES